MDRLQYVKYNRTRREPFRTATEIWEADDSKYVLKKTLSEKAAEHVRGMLINRKQLAEHYPKLSFVEGTAMENGVRFPYLQGTPLDQKLLACLPDRERFLQELKKAAEVLLDCREEVPFVACDEFETLFGHLDYEGPAVQPVNLDCLFENVIEQNGQLVCLDYEWYFPFAVPREFILYRCLLYLYLGNESLRQAYQSLDELLAEAGVLRSDLWKPMEDQFQQYVFGPDREEIYLKNYEYLGFSEGTLQQKYEVQEEQIRGLTALAGEQKELIDYYEGKIRVLKQTGIWKMLDWVRGRKHDKTE